MPRPDANRAMPSRLSSFGSNLTISKSAFLGQPLISGAEAKKADIIRDVFWEFSRRAGAEYVDRRKRRAIGHDKTKLHDGRLARRDVRSPHPSGNLDGLDNWTRNIGMRGDVSF